MNRNTKIFADAATFNLCGFPRHLEMATRPLVTPLDGIDFDDLNDAQRDEVDQNYADDQEWIDAVKSVIEVNFEANGITIVLTREYVYAEPGSYTNYDAGVVYRTVVYSPGNEYVRRTVEGIYEYTDKSGRGDAAQNQRESLKFLVGVFTQGSLDRG